SRYRSRLRLMKSMTLSITLRWRGSRLPLAAGVRRASLRLQLLEVRTHVFVRGRQQGRRETIIDGFGDRLHGGASGTERRFDLTLPEQTVRDVAGNHRPWIVDRGTVRRQQSRRVEGQQPFERGEVLREVAAAARVDHHAAAAH